MHVVSPTRKGARREAAGQAAAGAGAAGGGAGRGGRGLGGGDHGTLGEQSRMILADNYRSVLAAQRMKESLERIDSDVLFVAGRRTSRRRRARSRATARRFENELEVQEGNITERARGGDRALRGAWNGYARRVDRFLAPRGKRRAQGGPTFATLEPAFTRISRGRRHPGHQPGRHGAEERARPRAARLLEQVVTGAVSLASLLGLLEDTPNEGAQGQPPRRRYVLLISRAISAALRSSPPVSATAAIPPALQGSGPRRWFGLS